MNDSPPALPVYSVIGLPVHATTYQGATHECCRLAKQPNATAVSAANTHIAVMAREDPAFAETMTHFDLIVPDGAPLMWLMNLQGAALADRVYGPYLMRDIILQTPRPWKHYLFGGTDACLARLRTELLNLQPDLDLVGSFSPPFRAWTSDDLSSFANHLNHANADFIWIALGGGKQERLIQNLKPQLQNGCLLAVGDAFPLLAGERAFAPPLIQRCGLTWLWRLAQEPRRLLHRYWHCNSRFIRYAINDWRHPSTSP